jgi:hypothetical protein
MKKEVLLAIVIGFGIGLLITFGIYTARTALEDKPDSSDSSQESPVNIQNPNATDSAKLAISSPLNNALLETDKIQLTGTSNPQATISIVTTLSNQVLTSNDQGDFTADLELEGGANQVVVTAFTPQGDSVTVNLNLVYTTAKIE